MEQQSVARIINSSTVQNHATMFGGVLTCSLSAAVLIESTFSNNTSGISGGVICVEQESMVNTARCSFEFNLAGVRGGAIFMSTSTLIVNSSMFSDNGAKNSSNGTEYSEFAGRFIPKSTTYGGVIFAIQSNISLYAENTFRNNIAGFGGTIHVFGSIDIPGSSIPGGLCNLNIIKNGFVNNTVEGGVILSFGCYVSDLESTFQYNEPHSRLARELESEDLGNLSMVIDAVIIAISSLISLNKSCFTSNSAEIGATLFIVSSTITSLSILMSSFDPA